MNLAVFESLNILDLLAWKRCKYHKSHVQSNISLIVMHFGSIILKPAENKLPLLKYCINTLCNYQQTFNIFFSNNTMSIQNLSKPTWCNYQPSFLKILKPNFRRVFAYWPNNVITCYSGGKKAWISQLYMRLYGLMPRMTWWHTTVICVDHILVRSIVHGRHNEFQVCINTVIFFRS